MKKGISILILLAVAATGVFAMEPPLVKLSAGGGIYFDAGIPVWENSEGAVIGVGGYGFFDFTYAEVSAALGYYRLTDAEIYGADLNIGLLLKFPFIFDNFTIFPLIGAKFEIPLSQSYDGDSIDGFKVTDYIHFGLQGGTGMDFPLGNALYLRASALCNINFFAPGEVPPDETLHSVGPMIKIGIGYRF